MEMSTLKGIEFIVIIALVGWFYFKQTNDLKRLKAEREAKQEEESGGSRP